MYGRSSAWLLLCALVAAQPPLMRRSPMRLARNATRHARRPNATRHAGWRSNATRHVRRRSNATRHARRPRVDGRAAGDASLSAAGDASPSNASDVPPSVAAAANASSSPLAETRCRGLTATARGMCTSIVSSPGIERAATERGGWLCRAPRGSQTSCCAVFLTRGGQTSCCAVFLNTPSNSRRCRAGRAALVLHYDRHSYQRSYTRPLSPDTRDAIDGACDFDPANPKFPARRGDAGLVVASVHHNGAGPRV